MNAEPDVSRVARTIGEPTRIRMLALLMEGRALTAKELAYGAGVEPGTGTTHLQRLLADSLVTVRRQGRHKYFQLASADVARCIESLLSIAPVSRVDGATPPAGLHLARFCYDHLAGRIGTRITQALLEQRLLRSESGGFAVPARGRRWFAAFGIDLDALAHSRRQFAPACLDWSERQEHLGGALGATLAARMLAAGWLKRQAGSRLVTVTAAGREALAGHFGLPWD